MSDREELKGPDSSWKDEELPAVSPPSASFFVQLFLLPAVIVFGIMTVWYLFGQLAGANRSVEEYVAIIKSDRGDRWQAALDLSQLLKEGSEHTRNRKLALELTEELQKQLEANNTDDKSIQFLEYLIGAVGRFEMPIGVPALRLAATPKYKTAVRQKALLSLANLAVRTKSLDDPNVILEIPEYLTDFEVEIRETTAVLLGRLNDSRAIAPLVGVLGDSSKSVRYNAATSLAILGSDAGMTTYVSMLDRDALAREFYAEDEVGKKFVDEAVVAGTIGNAMISIRRLCDLKPGADFSIIMPALEKLAAGDNVRWQSEATDLIQRIKLITKERKQS